jgi:hypothetical protein
MKGYSMKISEVFNSFEDQRTLKESRILYRLIYNCKSHVSDFIDNKSAVRVRIKEIEKIRVSNYIKREYIFNFFKGMFSILNIQEVICWIIHECLLTGNCVVFSEDNTIEGTSSNDFDKNILYKGWKSLLVLSLDNASIKRIPISNKILLGYLPDPETLKHIKDKDSEVSDYIIKVNNEDSYTPLNTNPFIGSFATSFSMLSSGYDLMGGSIIEKYIEDFKEDKDVLMNIPEPTMEILKEKLKKFVEENLFRPVAIKKGFVDNYNNAIYPEVSIT